MRRSTVIIIMSMLLGMAMLAGLGNWQVQRLAWKEELIARTQSRLAAPPVKLAGIENIWQDTGDVDYMAVQVEGVFEHRKEMYYYTTWNGQAGWDVITPLRLHDNRYVLLNRGFVPLNKRDPATRLDGRKTGTLKIVGLARNPLVEKPNTLMPDNIPQKREFFWKSHMQLSILVGPDVQTLPFMIDAGKDQTSNNYPQGGTTRLAFPNNHLQYAATWYGLAFSLFLVGSVFLYGRRNQSA